MKVGFIGCGNMAKAMISGLLKSGVCKGEEVVASDVSPAARSAAQALGISVTADNRQAAAQADALVLAVKPQFYQEVIEGLRDSLRAGQLVITIAPGKTLAWLQERLGEEIAIVRTMPNTPAMVGEGITAMCPNGKVTEEQLALCRSLLESFGKAELVPERLMDAVVAVSGSSPAYVFLFIEAMADAASSVVEHFKGKIAFINVMKNLSVDCDCCAVAEDPCMKDIGIWASLDPVAIDQACIDLVVNSDDPVKEHFMERVNSRNGIHTIEAAADLGVGSRDYELIRL